MWRRHLDLEALFEVFQVDVGGDGQNDQSVCAGVSHILPPSKLPLIKTSGHSYFLLDTRTYPTCESRALGCESQKKYKAFAPLPGGDEKTLKEKTGATFK